LCKKTSFFIGNKRETDLPVYLRMKKLCGFKIWLKTTIDNDVKSNPYLFPRFRIGWVLKEDATL